MNIQYIISLISFLFLLNSCSNPAPFLIESYDEQYIHREYFNNANKVVINEYFYGSSNIHFGYKIPVYPKNIKIDTIKVFDKNYNLIKLRYPREDNTDWVEYNTVENTISFGKVNDSYIPIKEWTTYDSLGKKTASFSYKTIDNNAYMNSKITYNERGDIDKSNSIFYTWTVDTTSNSTHNLFTIKLNTPTENINDRSRRIILGAFDRTFSNYVELLANDEVTSGFLKENKQITLHIPKESVQLFRGVYIEYYPDDSHSVEYKIYFEMDINDEALIL